MTRIKFSDLEIAEKFAAQHQDLLYSSKDASFYIYENGVYSTIDEDKIKSIIISYCRNINYLDLTTPKLNSITGILRCLSEVSSDEVFNKDKLILNLKNGLFNLRTNELTPHTKEYKSSVQLNVQYDPEARCPRFTQVLKEVLPNKQIADYLLNVFFYLLLPTYEYEKIFLLRGSGRNGKGTLISVIQETLGSKNYEGLDLHLLTSRPFMLHTLSNKYANFCSENKLTTIDLDTLKRLSGNDQISAEIKYEKKPMQFKNNARIIIQCNLVPRIAEVDKAIINRLEVINFPMRFEGKHVDTALKDQLRSETSGIFNLLISQASQIIRPDESIKLNPPEIIEKMTLEAFEQLSNVAEFFSENYQLNDRYAYDAKQFYSEYKNWCYEYGYKAVGKIQCFNALRELKDLRIESLPKKQNQYYIFGIKENSSIVSKKTHIELIPEEKEPVEDATKNDPSNENRIQETSSSLESTNKPSLKLVA